MKKVFNEGNQIQNFISNSGSGTVINYGSGSGSDFLTSYGSGSASQKVTVPAVPIPKHWDTGCVCVQRRGGAEYFDYRKKGKI
jgi:hypothetical protein